MCAWAWVSVRHVDVGDLEGTLLCTRGRLSVRYV